MKNIKHEISCVQSTNIGYVSLPKGITCQTWSISKLFITSTMISWWARFSLLPMGGPHCAEFPWLSSRHKRQEDINVCYVDIALGARDNTKGKRCNHEAHVRRSTFISRECGQWLCVWKKRAVYLRDRFDPGGVSMGKMCKWRRRARGPRVMGERGQELRARCRDPPVFVSTHLLSRLLWCCILSVFRVPHWRLLAILLSVASPL